MFYVGHRKLLQKTIRNMFFNEFYRFYTFFVNISKNINLKKTIVDFDGAIKEQSFKLSFIKKI